MIQDTGRLFLRNLAFSATEDDVRRLLEPFGALEQVKPTISNANLAPLTSKVSLGVYTV